MTVRHSSSEKNGPPAGIFLSSNAYHPDSGSLCMSSSPGGTNRGVRLDKGTVLPGFHILTRKYFMTTVNMRPSPWPPVCRTDPSLLTLRGDCRYRTSHRARRCPECPCPSGRTRYGSGSSIPAQYIEQSFLRSVLLRQVSRRDT